MTNDWDDSAVEAAIDELREQKAVATPPATPDRAVEAELVDLRQRLTTLGTYTLEQMRTKSRDHELLDAQIDAEAQGRDTELWKARAEKAEAALASPSSNHPVGVNAYDLARRMRDHVVSRGGASKDKYGNPVIPNGAWSMMLQAADELERLSSCPAPSVVSVTEADVERALDQEIGPAWREEHSETRDRVFRSFKRIIEAALGHTTVDA